MAIARPDSGPRTAFVLSGGGNLAVSQVGMLRALVEREVLPDVVVGTSAGALNGAVLATDPTIEGVERLTDVWCSLRAGEVFPGGKLSRAWNVLSRDDHLFSNEGLQAIIERADPAETFEQTAVPLRVIATDLQSGEEVVFAAGAIPPTLLASAALPGIYPPVEHDGRTLIDGAVTNSVPLSHVLDDGIERVYVLNVAGGGPGERPIRSPLDVAVRAFNISRNQRFDLEMRNTPPGIDVIVLPRPDDDRELLDFSDALMLTIEAHALVAKFLDAGPDIVARRPSKRRWWRRNRVA
ncbi:MAG TPA: patatin-like phospholipase family protein [Acidimicrobiia bacterium]